MKTIGANAGRARPEVMLRFDKRGLSSAERVCRSRDLGGIPCRNSHPPEAISLAGAALHLATADGNVSIFDNAGLTSLDALGGLASVGGDWTIGLPYDPPAGRRPIP